MAKSRPQRRQVFWRRGGSTTSEPVRGPPTGRRARTVTQLTGLARTVGARGGHEGPGGHPGPHLCCPVLAYCKPCDEASPPPGAWTLSPLWTHASTSGLGKPRRGFPQASTAFIVFENLLMNITTGLLHPTTGSRIRSYYRPPTHSRILVKVLQGRNAPVGDLGAHVAAAVAALAVADESCWRRGNGPSTK